MASITERNGKYQVIITYTDDDGKRHQKWEAFSTLAEAKRRRAEVEYQQHIGSFSVPKCTTVRELSEEYVSLYGKTKWSISAYSTNLSMLNHYILPIIGNMKVAEITPRVLEKYYQTLLKTQAAPRITDRPGKKKDITVSTCMIRKIHNLLRSMFTQAEKWEMIEKNPARLATVPKHESKKRDIWDAETLLKALEVCDDKRLSLCINLAFACSLRIGELLALTWDCVDVSEESIQAGKASIFITKEIQRVNKSVMETLDQKDTMLRFPEQGPKNKTVLVLKKPKTASSVRKVYLPTTVAEMLVEWKKSQDHTKEALGDEYFDYNLVITTAVGQPMESSRIRDSMKRLIEENNLPPVVFHSLRHSSITYKLKLNGGDIKSVQGDSGHSQASMVTDQYSHILDEGRQKNARLIEQAFYGGHGTETGSQQNDDTVTQQANAAGIDPELLMKVLANPDMVNLLKSLSQTIK